MTEVETEYIVDKATELVESRKFFETESLEEYCLVSKAVMHDLFYALYKEGKVIAGFNLDKKRYFQDKDFQ